MCYFWIGSHAIWKYYEWNGLMKLGAMPVKIAACLLIWLERSCLLFSNIVQSRWSGPKCLGVTYQLFVHQIQVGKDGRDQSRRNWKNSKWNRNSNYQSIWSKLEIMDIAFGSIFNWQTFKFIWF